jgi:aspartate kinase
MRIVQKYGGSSVADVARIRRVAQRVAGARAAGHEVVVVVSAMGNTTNELLALAREVSQSPGRRELDMLISVGERVTMALLAMALQELGVSARSFTGSQSGIITDEAHANARVVEVRADRVLAALEQGEVAIVAGFQGVSRQKEVTTLGRGGSDTTAVVLAAALHADECEICSDVDGVWSADPRVVPEARKIDRLSLDEGLAMAQNGAKVLYEEAVSAARRLGVTIRASASTGEGTGTVLSAGQVGNRIVSVVSDSQLAQLPLAALSTLPGPCVRFADASRVIIDLRNLHSAVAGQLPVATVSVVGERVGADPTLLGKVLQAAGSLPDHFWTSTDAVSFLVNSSAAASLERHLHLAFVARSGIQGAP